MDASFPTFPSEGTPQQFNFQQWEKEPHIPQEPIFEYYNQEQSLSGAEPA